MNEIKTFEGGRAIITDVERNELVVGGASAGGTDEEEGRGGGERIAKTNKAWIRNERVPVLGYRFETQQFLYRDM